MHQLTIYQPKEPWNKNKLVGQRLPLKLQQIWAIRIRLELFHKIGDLALFNLAIDRCSGQLILATVLESWYLTSDSFGAKPAL